jgi:hypothetical protein
MKKIFTFFLLSAFFAVGFIKSAAAQDDPVAYLSAINSAQTDMNKSYMAYISAAAHSSRKRKIEKLRGQAVDNIVICQNTINNLSPYKGDNSLRQSSVGYVQLCYKIFNDDYAHIVNMEDIAERSYDEMQAYLLLQQATNDTLAMAISKMQTAEQAFASKYGVTLVDQKTELGEKMAQTDRMGKYHDIVYLLFYKCNWEDGQMIEALNQKNVTKVEQDRNALDKYAIEGLAVLDTMKSFDNDGSLVNACRQALTFYKTEAETQVSLLTDFFLKEENFNKLKAAMDAKSDSQRTQQDVDSYNKAVTDLNNGVNTFNLINNDLNNGRNNATQTWDATEKNFIDIHTPYYK